MISVEESFELGKRLVAEREYQRLVISLDFGEEQGGFIRNSNHQRPLSAIAIRSNSRIFPECDHEEVLNMPLDQPTTFHRPRS